MEPDDSVAGSANGQWAPSGGLLDSGALAGADARTLSAESVEPPDSLPLRELQAAALESTGSAVMITAADGRIAWVNRAFTKMSGYSAFEAVGLTPRLLKSGRHDAGYYERLWATILDGRVWRGEVVDRRKDGSHYSVLQTITPITDASGAITHFVAAHEDVTELRASQAQLQAVFDHAPDGIVLFDDDGRLLAANPVVSEWTGYQREQLMTMTLAELVPEGLRDRYRRGWDRFRAAGKGRGTMPILGRDGKLVEVEYQSVVGIADGLHLAVAREMTAQREAEAQQRFQSQLLESVGDAVIATDLDGVVRYANPAAERLYGWFEQEALDRPITELNVPSPSAEQAQEILAPVRVGQSWTGRFEVARHDGTTFPALVSTAPYLDATGLLAGTIGVSTDISDLAAAQRLLARRARQQAAVAELGQAGMLTDDPSALAAQARQMVIDVLGPDIAIERRPGADPSPATSQGEGIRVDLGLGSDMVLDISGVAIDTLDADGEEFLRSLTHIVDAARQRCATAAQFEHLATHDPLTGLPNRTLFLDRLEQTRAACQRSQKPFAVLFLDLDGLKVINDGLGHDAGDEALRLVAERLRGVVRPADTVARFGGDEFALLCPDIADETTANQLAQRIGSALTKGLPTSRGTVAVTASIGIRLGDATTEGPSLLRDVDTAMYAAKAAGRNRAELFDAAMQQQAQHRFRSAAAIQSALDRDAVEVRYQPTINLATGRIVGVEALARLRTADGALIPPDEFIAVAEETGLIGALGTAVLRRACRTARAWLAIDPSFMLSVNLSPRQLSHPDIAETIEDTLGDARIEPTSLWLEITESTLLSGPSVPAAMHRLRRDGIRFAIDDFGTGYSSLAHLRHMPVDMLKIDRDFVSGLQVDIADHALVAATIDLAHAFALATTAEGVQTPEQLADLTALGCDYAQGYLWSPPVEADEITDMLRTPPARM